ncbi:MAG TPA: BRCT domain-containing protein [Rhodanobacter sp.]
MGIFSRGAPMPFMTEKARRDRNTDELIGICRGILADGGINISEAYFLLDWLERHRESLGVFPFDVLHRRVSDALTNGVLDSDEERDLLEALTGTVGGESATPGSSASLSTALPFDDPLPPVTYSESVFVVTGTFEYGSRKVVVEAIQSHGGIVRAAVSKTVRFLIVGEIGSRDWKHSSFGRKIEEAVALRSAGVGLCVLPERYWRTSLQG